MASVPNNNASFPDLSIPFFKVSMPLIVGYTIGYTTIFVLSLIGNIIVIVTVIRNRSMHTVINYFICNLSIADLLCAICVLPTTLLQTLLSEWRMGEFLCRSTTYLQGVTVFASVTTLTIVAFDRFQAICCPLKRLITKNKAKYIIATIWVFAFVLLSPWAVFYRTEYTKPYVENNITLETSLLVCVERWPDGSDGIEFFIGFNFIGCYIAPLFLISGFYSAIAIKLWRRLDGNKPGSNGAATIRLTNTTGGIDREKSIKVVKMLITVVSLFALSWLPCYTVFMIYENASGFSDETRANIVNYLIPLCQLLAASNTCVNPWIYCLYSKTYRDSFQKIMCCRRRTRERMSNSYSENLRTRMVANSNKQTKTTALTPIICRVPDPQENHDKIESSM